MRILVDMDEVIAGFLAGVDAILDGYDTSAPKMPRMVECRDWNMHLGLTPVQSTILSRAMSAPGLFLSLPPLEGAIEALHEMLEAGHDVRLVTSPMASNPTCASDKFAWVAKHLGTPWTHRLVITDDKTIIRGDVLFDDKGEITGSMKPEWQQILVDQPHNRYASKPLPRIADLTHWRIALETIKEKQA